MPVQPVGTWSPWYPPVSLVFKPKFRFGRAAKAKRQLNNVLHDDHGKPLPLKGNALIDWLKAHEAWRRSVRLFGVALFLGLGLLAPGNSVWARTLSSDSGIVQVSELPEQARETLALIKQGGPFPYAQDGTVFSNRERLLPIAPRGTYREYTVKTPGRHDRGGRRIVASSTGQFWYSEDHYGSFRRIVE